MTKISLKGFLDELESRLDAFSKDDLQMIIQQMASSVAPDDRQGFLEKLVVHKKKLSKNEKEKANKLLDEIREFCEEVEADMENAEDRITEYEWDHHPYYGEGDPEDTPYMDHDDALDGLFDRVQFTWDEGLFKEARSAYEALLDLLEKEDEYGYHLNHPDNFDESMAHYLRSVMVTEKQGHRAKSLLEAMRRLQREHPHYCTINLSAIVQIAQDPLPDQSAFLNEWITHLHDHADDLSDILLREAIGIRDGATGLEALAKTEGQRRPRAYVDWLVELERTGEPKAVVKAANRALNNLVDTPIRAEVADVLFRAAENLGDTKKMQESRWTAFCAVPDLERMIQLWEVHQNIVNQIAIMAKAREFIENCQRDSSDESNSGIFNAKNPYSPDKSVWTHTVLLSADWKSVWEKSEKQTPLGWSSSNSEQGLAVLSALVWMHGESTPLPPQLESLWKQQLRSGSYYFRSVNDARFDKLEHAYLAVIEAHQWTKQEILSRLSQCEGLIRRRVSAIVSNTHRGAYERAALLVVAYAETLRFHDKGQDANRWVTEIRKAFPRHSAFQSEMKTALVRAKK